MGLIRFLPIVFFLLIIPVLATANLSDLGISDFVPPIVPDYTDKPINGFDSRFGCLIMQSTDLKSSAQERKMQGLIEEQKQIKETQGIVEGYTLRTNGPLWEEEPLDLKKIPLPGILVTDIFSQTYSNQDARYVMDSPHGLILSLPFRKGISIVESSGKKDYFPMKSYIFQKYKPVPIGDLTYPNESLDVSQINVYHHTQKAAEWLGYEPEHIYAFTNSGVKCNAYAYLLDKYITFGREVITYSRHCPNTAYSTIIVHEYGHQLLQDFQPYPVCPGNGPCEFLDFEGYTEGIADAFSSLVLEDNCIGKDLYGKGKGCLRNVDEDWVYPINDSLGPHERGRPLSGSFWDLRKLLIEEYGEEYANEVLKNLFLYTVKDNHKGLHKELTGFVLRADEFHYDSKHSEHIIDAFTKHGFSSG